ncbi:MAG: hypothetical protein ACTHLW_20260, partial [Verrucomicrobiota bacterium]
LLSCAESALISAEWVSNHLKQYANNPNKLPPQPFLNQLQNIALQGAAISRFFWPTGKKYQKRGAFLRGRFKLDDNNPLKSRELRNHMEHYDEYLDDYFSARHIVGHILPDYVGPEPSVEEVPYHLFRAYFIDTGRVAILGVRFELQPLVDEISRLHELLRKCDETGSRLPE